MQFTDKRFDWESLRVFLAVARNNSIRAGARALGIGHSTASRRIQALEVDLGGKLFESVEQGLALTETGERVLEHVERVEGELFDLERSVIGRDAQPAGLIRLTLPPPLAYGPLMTDIVAFNGLYPDIKLEIVTSYTVSDLNRRDADVAIRFMEKPEDWLLGRRLPTFKDAIYASPDYVNAHSFEGKHPTAHWIGWPGDNECPSWIKSMPHPNCSVKWTIGDINAQAAAARAGLGMALLPCWVGDLDSGLIRVPPGEIAYERTAWILTHPDLKTTERVRLFTRYMMERVTRHKDVFQGKLS